MKQVKKFISANIREISLVAVMIVLSVFFNIMSKGTFLTGTNIQNMFNETAILLILSIGMMMVIVTSGIDLSIGAIMALGGMVGCTVLKNNLSIPPIVIILIAVAVGIVCGLINGLLIAKIKILPLIATLGMMNIFRGTTYLIANGSWVLQNNMSKEFLSVATGTVLGINNLVWIAILLIIIAYVFLNYTTAGRRIYAVGNSEESARVSGIRTDRTLIGVYVIMGAVAGLAGILYVCKFAAAQGETAVGYEMNVVAACVLGGVSVTGGTGKLPGVVLGAILLGMVTNALPLINVSPFWQDAIRGMIILFSIVMNALIQRNVRMKALRRRTI